MSTPLRHEFQNAAGDFLCIEIGETARLLWQAHPAAPWTDQVARPWASSIFAELCRLLEEKAEAEGAR